MSDKDRINIGDFDTIVNIQQSSRAKDSFGQVKEEWTALQKCFAKVEYSVKEISKGEQLDILETVEITTHYLRQLNTKHRVVIDDKTYNIIELKETVRRQFITIKALEYVA